MRDPASGQPSTAPGSRAECVTAAVNGPRGPGGIGTRGPGRRVGIWHRAWGTCEMTALAPAETRYHDRGRVNDRPSLLRVPDCPCICTRVLIVSWGCGGRTGGVTPNAARTGTSGARAPTSPQAGRGRWRTPGHGRRRSCSGAGSPNQPVAVDERRLDGAAAHNWPNPAVPADRAAKDGMAPAAGARLARSPPQPSSQVVVPRPRLL
jgi:hypothetical protein